MNNDLERLALNVTEAVMLAIHEGHRVTRKCHARIAEHAARSALAEAYQLGREAYGVPARTLQPMPPREEP